jgi:hypothetical protein
MNNHKSIKRSFYNQKICKGDKDHLFIDLNRASFNINDEVYFDLKDQIVKGKIIKILHPNNVSRQYRGKDAYLVSYSGGKKVLRKNKIHREISCPCFQRPENEFFKEFRSVNSIIHNKFFKE